MGTYIHIYTYVYAYTDTDTSTYGHVPNRLVRLSLRFGPKPRLATRCLICQFRTHFVQIWGRFERKLGGLSRLGLLFWRSGFNDVPIVRPSIPASLPNLSESGPSLANLVWKAVFRNTKKNGSPPDLLWNQGTVRFGQGFQKVAKSIEFSWCSCENVSFY